MSNEMRLFSVTNERPLAVKVSKALGVPLCEIELQKFSDGEVKINMRKRSRNQLLCTPVGE